MCLEQSMLVTIVNFHVVAGDLLSVPTGITLTLLPAVSLLTTLETNNKNR